MPATAAQWTMPLSSGDAAPMTHQLTASRDGQACFLDSHTSSSSTSTPRARLFGPFRRPRGAKRGPIWATEGPLLAPPQTPGGAGPPGHFSLKTRTVSSRQILAGDPR
eukprot:scaffold7377_cov389-Prasinococcus_capsulatus_cf.AAC.9